MAIKLGNTDINKLYLGSTEVQKVYLGNILILDNSVPPFDSGLILNGTFDNSNDLTFDGGWQIVNGEASCTAGSQNLIFDLSQNLNSSTNYTFNVDITSTAGNARFRVWVFENGSWNSVVGNITYPLGTATINFTTPSGTLGNQIRITSSSEATNFNIDNSSLIQN